MLPRNGLSVSFRLPNAQIVSKSNQNSSECWLLVWKRKVIQRIGEIRLRKMCQIIKDEHNLEFGNLLINLCVFFFLCQQLFECILFYFIPKELMCLEAKQNQH